MTGVPSEDVPGMVEVSGAGILSLTARPPCARPWP